MPKDQAIDEATLRHIEKLHQRVARLEVKAMKKPVGLGAAAVISDDLEVEYSDNNRYDIDCPGTTGYISYFVQDDHDEYHDDRVVMQFFIPNFRLDIPSGSYPHYDEDILHLLQKSLETLKKQKMQQKFIGKYRGRPLEAENLTCGYSHVMGGGTDEGEIKKIIWFNFTNVG